MRSEPFGQGIGIETPGAGQGARMPAAGCMPADGGRMPAGGSMPVAGTPGVWGTGPRAPGVRGTGARGLGSGEGGVRGIAPGAALKPQGWGTALPHGPEVGAGIIFWYVTVNGNHPAGVAAATAGWSGTAGSGTTRSDGIAALCIWSTCGAAGRSVGLK